MILEIKKEHTISYTADIKIKKCYTEFYVNKLENNQNQQIPRKIKQQK